MFVFEKKHIKLLIGGFIISFIGLTTLLILFMSFLFEAKYKTIYTNDISIIKEQLEKQQETNSTLLASIDASYKGVISQKDNEIESLKTDIKELETLFIVYKENKDADIQTIMEYAYALDQSRSYYLTYGDIQKIIGECKKENFNDKTPHLVAALLEYESDLNPKEVSRSGARGIAQFKDSTAEWIYEDYLGYKDYKPEYAYDKQIAIQMCVKYLSILYDQYKGDVNKMLTGYNEYIPGNNYYKYVNEYMTKNTGYSINDVCKTTEGELQVESNKN
jgi:hypothetical protein